MSFVSSSSLVARTKGRENFQTFSKLFGLGANQRKSVMENTKSKNEQAPNKPSSIMLARNMLASSADHVPGFVRLAASSVIT